MPGIREQHTAPSSVFRKSLRTSLTLLILIPVLALAGLWGYTATVLVDEGLQLRSDADLATESGPAHTVVARLQEERRRTAVWQAKPNSAAQTAMETARASTDSAVGSFRASRAALQSASAAVQDGVTALDDALDQLSPQRDAIDKRDLSSARAFRYYTDTAAAGTGLVKAATRNDDGELAHRFAAVNALVQSTEMFSREDALLSGALASGRLTSTTRADFASHVAAQRQILGTMRTEDLPKGEASAYEGVTDSSPWALMVSIEDAVVSGSSGLPGEAESWREAADSISKELLPLGPDAVADVAGSGSDRADGLLLRAALGTLVALAAIAVTVVLARRFSRALFDRLSQLRGTTMELADTRLPRIVERLAVGELVDPAEQAPDRDYGTDELGRLGEAVHHLRRAVVVTTVRQAQGRDGTKKVFVNLARRTQVLIHRQISMLDGMERKHESPELLEELFAVDHLATRVRRHAENLVILGGSLPARRWSDAVPVVNVLRSALSETEAYTRVKVQPIPRMNLVGQAVADVVHLVAELIENGTSFSPPDTQVSVGAEKVTKGLVFEVEDRGLGMPEEEYARINAMLANPPELDVMILGEDPRLGLFVVARLAGRHGIEVSLRKSPYGGTLAIVLLPGALLEEPKSVLAGIPGLSMEGQAATTATTEPVAAEPMAPTEPMAPAAAWAPAEPVVPAAAWAPAEPDALAEPSAPGEPVVLPAGAGLIMQQPDADDYFGLPTLGGAGLLPMAPGDHVEVDDAPVPPVAPRSPEEADIEAGHSRPTGDDMPQEPSPELATPRILPKRVKQASLADQLREVAGYSHPDQEEDEADAVPTDLSATTMAAIQRETRRARETEPAEPAGSPEEWGPEAETPGEGAGTGPSAMKDDR